MTEADKQKISEIMERHGVIVGYLFGSAARGTMGSHSDIDLGVVFAVDNSEQDDFNRRVNLAHDISCALNVPEADIINLRTARGPLIKYQAIFGGEVILEKDRDARFAVEQSAVREYEDTRHLRRIRDDILCQELQNGTFGKVFV